MAILWDIITDWHCRRTVHKIWKTYLLTNYFFKDFSRTFFQKISFPGRFSRTKINSRTFQDYWPPCDKNIQCFLILSLKIILSWKKVIYTKLEKNNTKLRDNTQLNKIILSQGNNTKLEKNNTKVRNNNHWLKNDTDI